MLAARLILGLGIGCKSATVPVYTAECAPAKLRGALTMQWQMWTAFGIMVGFASDLAFYNVKDVAGIVGLNWRLMMGSASLFAWFVVAGAWACPESPRYLIDKAGRAGINDPLTLKQKAWNNMLRLRKTELSAARDTYVMLKSAEAQALAASSRKGVFYELFMVGRNRRAMIASEITMFMQQVCSSPMILWSID
jgi:MFS family permease